LYVCASRLPPPASRAYCFRLGGGLLAGSDFVVGATTLGGGAGGGVDGLSWITGGGGEYTGTRLGGGDSTRGSG